MPIDDAYTVALLHMDGADASTTFTDESGKSWTANGNAQIDTAQSKFGGASGLFDGTDSVSSVDSADWDFGTADFSIDFWVRFNALPASGSAENFVWRDRTAGGQMIRVTVINVAGTYTLRAALDNVAKNQTWSSPSTGTWYHIAITRSGTSLYHFIDGTQVGSTLTSSENIADTTALNVGGNGTSAEGVNGWLDEVRISKGIARWTANFTPPTTAYAPAANGNFFSFF